MSEVQSHAQQPGEPLLLVCSVIPRGKAHKLHPIDFHEFVTKSQFQALPLPITKCSQKFSYSCTNMVKSRFSQVSFGGKKISESPEYSHDSHFPGCHIKECTGDLQNKKRDSPEPWTLMVQTAVPQLLLLLVWHTNLSTHCALLNTYNQKKRSELCKWKEINAPFYTYNMPHFPRRCLGSVVPLNGLTVVCKSTSYKKRYSTKH